jgi:Holliday junction resolvase RusA-like endonuclease
VTEPVIIELPGVPVAKGRAKFARVGRGEGSFVTTYTPKPTRTYEEALRVLAREAMNGRPMLTGPLVITVTATRPLLKSFTKAQRQAAILGWLRPTTKPDTDNYLKIAKDALNCIVYADDAQVVDDHVSKFYGEEPGLRIEVRPLRAALEQMVAA